MTVEEILRTPAVIAVVGLSRSRFRASHGVSRYMQSQGFRIVPVNPNLEEALGEKAFPDLESIPFPVTIVNVFRRPEFVPAVVESAIRIGARCVWMQEGIRHDEAAARARQAGLIVVMDRCIMATHLALRNAPESR